MIESLFDLTTPDGEMPSFMVRPDGDGPWPVVLFMMDAPGMREEIRSMCRRVASNGYYVLTSQLYYRDVAEFNVFETGDRDRMFELMGNLSNAMAVADQRSLIEHAATDPAADTSRVGTAGYCMSGPFVVKVAEAMPDAVKAAMSVHGVRLVTDKPDSPHLALPNVAAELLIACAETDSYAPPEMIAEFEAAMTGAGTRGGVEWFPGTEHGFAYAERPQYVEDASERHWTRMLDLFERNLKG